MKSLILLYLFEIKSGMEDYHFIYNLRLINDYIDTKEMNEFLFEAIDERTRNPFLFNKILMRTSSTCYISPGYIDHELILKRDERKDKSISYNFAKKSVYHKNLNPILFYFSQEYNGKIIDWFILHNFEHLKNKYNPYNEAQIQNICSDLCQGLLYLNDGKNIDNTDVMLYGVYGERRYKRERWRGKSMLFRKIEEKLNDANANGTYKFTNITNLYTEEGYLLSSKKDNATSNNYNIDVTVNYSCHVTSNLIAIEHNMNPNTINVNLRPMENIRAN